MTNYELYHAGVKGMKWGVRKDKTKTASTTARSGRTPNTTVVKTNKRGTTTITSRNGNQKAKMTIRRNKGAKIVAKTSNAKVKIVVSNTAAVAAGALRVAAAFIPGASILNGVATAASLVGTVASIKK